MANTQIQRNQRTRRTFIKDLGVVGASVLLVHTGCDDDSLEEIVNNRPMRMKLPGFGTSPSSKVFQDIDVYKDAISQMQNLPSDDPRSWVAQASIHGTDSGFTFCHSQQWNSNGPYFLPWHRGYLFQFEEICRELTGEESFALPYWNWALDKSVPSDFSTQNSNPLFTVRARDTLDGSPGTPSPFSHVRLNQIFQGSYIGFSNNLRTDPHNTAHWWIGGVLGAPNSPLDPLFWCHHCMVDYCWYDWQVVQGNTNPEDNSWRNQTWNHFVNRDGTARSIDAGSTVLYPLLNHSYEETAITEAPEIFAANRMNARSFNNVNEIDSLKQTLLKGGKVNFSIGRVVPIQSPSVIRSNRLQQTSSIKISEFERVIPNQTTQNRIYLRTMFKDLPESNDFYVQVYINVDSSEATREPAGGFSFFGIKTDQSKNEIFYTDISDTVADLMNNGTIKSTDELKFNLEILQSNSDRNFNNFLASADLDVIIADPKVEINMERLF